MVSIIFKEVGIIENNLDHKIIFHKGKNGVEDNSAIPRKTPNVR